MKTLYVINSPSYVENHPIHTCGQLLENDPLSEHFTYLYYNLVKFGLIDRVVVFPRRGQHDNFKKDFAEKIEIDNDKCIIINWDRERMIDIINSDPLSYVYCWSDYEVCQKIKNSFVMVNPVVAINNRSRLNTNYLHYALIEGMSHEKKFRLIPDNMPIGVCPLTSKKFSKIDLEVIRNTKKEYDWIMVSSFDPRKRHLDFLRLAGSNPRFSSLKGCIIARNPDNKGRINDSHHVYNQIINSRFMDNIDIHMNTTNEKKIDLLSKSKIYACISSLDFGPRATIEALQLALPVLSSPHMGACDWIFPNENGEIIKEDLSDMNKIFYQMLDKYEDGHYVEGSRRISSLLTPEKIYPSLVEDISQQFHKKFGK